MCGISGIILSSNCGRAPIEEHIHFMLESTHQRGPDSHGVWLQDNVALGHNRLSILDLSEAGHQPMVSDSGRYILTYNGEIYNAPELAKTFPISHAWRGHSDTEVILAVIERDGLEKAVLQFAGMFAFGLYDQKTRELHLVRDPIGIKPLYYSVTPERTLFASQIKAFAALPDFKKEISHEAKLAYFKYNYIPAPLAIYKNCEKLLPGHILTIQNNEIVKNTPYWSMEDYAQKGLLNPIRDHQEAIEAVEAALNRSIREQLVADVPVGVFLSGGIDSSLVAALSQQHSSTPIKTFTIGFEEHKYNEAVEALQISRYLGTEHTEEYMPIEKAIQLIPEIPFFCDEPFADASQLPTLLVSQLAKKNVTVVLSGDGGDEFFAGYKRYEDILNFQRMSQATPTFVKKVFQFMINKGQSITGSLLGEDLSFKLHMASRSLKYDSVDDIYDHLFDFWPHMSDQKKVERACSKDLPLSDLGYMQFHDSIRYLPDDILTKVDRCSMHVSLESRVPLLDHRLVELSWCIDESLKIRNGETKWILRKILSKYIPRSFMDQPKKGFSVPIHHWLRGSLKDWARSLLDQMKDEGDIPFAPIEKCWEDHQKGLVNWQYALWGALMWQHWKNSIKN